MISSDGLERGVNMRQIAMHHLDCTVDPFPHFNSIIFGVFYAREFH